MGKAKFWIEQTADKVEDFVKRTRGEDAGAIICASGVSPSGPIHLGNLREVMTVHLVTEELKRRGRAAEHIHSWDDFDRLRKVPAGLPEEFARFIGRPLSDIPDPFGEYDSYASRYIEEFTRSMDSIGVRPRYIRQSAAYRRGDYREQIKRAIAERTRIFDILVDYQTPGRHERPVEERRAEYNPFRVYCESCGKDTTLVTGYDEATAAVSYTCSECGNRGSFSLDEKVEGKLVWKVDWPMRWRYEGVDFEPGGEDHSAPGSSYTVGKRVVKDVYGGHAPFFIGYAFVGMTGRSKISSSAGTSVTPAAALDILEPCILRWLYIRRNVNQKFDIDFGQEVLRLYDEWDAFSARVASGKANEAEALVYERAVRTSAGEVGRSALPVPFRILASAADITQGNFEQILRIVSQHLEDPPAPATLREQIEPRLTCAINWATKYLPEDERTQVRERHDDAVFDALSDEHKRAIRMLVERMDEDWSLQGLTKLLYGVPKLLLGLPMDAPPNDEIKQFQRSFFVSLYMLLCGSDTGPRLPTLFLSLGRERVSKLLLPEGEQASATPK